MNDEYQRKERKRKKINSYRIIRFNLVWLEWMGGNKENTVFREVLFEWQNKEGRSITFTNVHL